METSNLCLKTLTIPEICKTGKIVPKPGKPVHHGTSYRPITLLSTVIKVLESLIVPAFQENIHLAEHGFRFERSTTTALYEIVV